MILAILGCHRTDEPARIPPAGTAVTGDTGCTPAAEVIGDGVDEACNGWADEYGLGESAEAAADPLMVGDFETFVFAGAFGQSVDAGVDGEGRSWLATSGTGSATLDAAPVDGAFELRVKGIDMNFGSIVRVSDWEHPLVVAEFGLFVNAIGGTGVVDQPGWNGSEDIGIAAIGMEVGDVDNDGVDELIVSNQRQAGVYPSEPSPTDGMPPAQLIIDDPGGNAFGARVGEVGDLTGDGLAELTVSEIATAVGGRVWIFPGDLTGEVLAGDVGWSLTGEEENGQAGESIALGDVDGDGYLDVVTGAFVANERGGVSYAYPGPITTDGSLGDGRARFERTIPFDFCGLTTETLADQDGDGADEVVIGCPGDPYFGPALPGRVEVYSGLGAVGTLDATDADRVLVGRAPGDLFASTLTADGDVSGDGVADLVVGAPFDPGDAGAVYVFPSPLW